MAKQKTSKKQEKTQQKVNDSKSSNVPTRGRTFEGYVTKKFSTRVVIVFERTVYVQKYERFYKKKTKLHARLPQNINVEVGDYVRIKETRPLSKIIHFIVTDIVRKAAEAKQ
ncbi:30S ribosomal protein S17 [Candidatus Pacearchaeota archaeon]|nr:30S ribosomal protein S17 [Candidatus Pacearchaeota archaeon]